MLPAKKYRMAQKTHVDKPRAYMYISWIPMSAHSFKSQEENLKNCRKSEIAVILT